MRAARQSRQTTTQPKRAQRGGRQTDKQQEQQQPKHN
jgi:hypothetical protein